MPRAVRTNSGSPNIFLSRFKRKAGGRLAHFQRARGAADAARSQQRIEHHQQVQIDIRDIHGAYILYTCYRSFQMIAGTGEILAKRC